MHADKPKMPFDNITDHMEYAQACLSYKANPNQHYSFYEEVEKAHIQVFEDHGDRVLIEFVRRTFENNGEGLFYDWLRGQYGE